MKNTPTKIFIKTLYESIESSSSICVQCNQSVFLSISLEEAIFGWIRQVKVMPAFENCEFMNTVKQEQQTHPLLSQNACQSLIRSYITDPFLGQEIWRAASLKSPYF